MLRVIRGSSPLGSGLIQFDPVGFTPIQAYYPISDLRIPILPVLSRVYPCFGVLCRVLPCFAVFDPCLGLLTARPVASRPVGPESLPSILHSSCKHARRIERGDPNPRTPFGKNQPKSCSPGANLPPHAELRPAGSPPSLHGFASPLAFCVRPDESPPPFAYLVRTLERENVRNRPPAIGREAEGTPRAVRVCRDGNELILGVYVAHVEA